MLEQLTHPQYKEVKYFAKDLTNCLWFLFGIILRRLVSPLKFKSVPFVFSIKLLAVQDLLDREALDKVKWGFFSRLGCSTVWVYILLLPWFAALQTIWLTTQGNVLRNVLLRVFQLFNVLLLCKCHPPAPPCLTVSLSPHLCVGGCLPSVNVFYF